MMRTLAILLLATITIGAAQRIVSCENDHWRLGDRSRKVESCNECAGRNSQGDGCEGECKWNDDRKTCVHKVNNLHKYNQQWGHASPSPLNDMFNCRLSTSTTWWTVAMASKHPLAANVAQTSETMSVAGNAPGILNVPMSALGKVRHKYKKY